MKIGRKHYSEGDFNANDEYAFSTNGKFIMRAHELYNSKSKMEAFIHIHGVLEGQLFAIWGIFLMKSLDEKFVPLKQFWNFYESIKLLEQAGLLDKTLISKLNAFKKGRDSVAHYFTNKFHKKQINDKTLNDQFNKGIEAFVDLINLRKMLVESIETPPEITNIKIQALHNPASTSIQIFQDGVISSTFSTTSSSWVDITGISFKKDKKKRILKNFTIFDGSKKTQIDFD